MCARSASVEEPRLMGALRHYLGDDAPADAAALAERMEGWRPFRTWAVVLIRRAAYEDGVG